MIKFTTINIDGKTINRMFENIKEIKSDWNDEINGTTLPSLDDKLLAFTVNGENIPLTNGETFSRVIQYLSIENQSYS